MNDNSYEQYISSDSWVTVRLVSRPPTRDSVSQIRLLLVESFIACRTPGHVTLCVCVRVCVCVYYALFFRTPLYVSATIVPHSTPVKKVRLTNSATNNHCPDFYSKHFLVSLLL